MKIEIDLNDILRDEYGDGESLPESIRRQVVEHLVATAKKGVEKQINEAVAQAIDISLKAAVTEQMPALVADLMNAEYRTVGRYGERGGVTTFRAELIKSINEQMVYRKTTHSNDASTFTKAVDAVVSENIATFKAQFGKLVNDQFMADAMKYATEQMAARLGIKK